MGGIESQVYKCKGYQKLRATPSRNSGLFPWIKTLRCNIEKSNPFKKISAPEPSRFDRSCIGSTRFG